MNHLTLMLDCPSGRIPVGSFLIAIKNLSGLLSEVERQIEPKQVGSRWAVVRLSMSSPVTIQIAPLEPRARETARFAIDRTVAGFRELEKHEVRPQYFTDEALSRARAVMGILDQKSITGVHIRDGDESVEVSHKLVAHVDVLIERKITECEGAIEGKLEVINVHTGLKVIVYRHSDNRPITASIIDAGGMMESVKDALGKRVYASGTLKRDKYGEIVEIQIGDIKVLPPDSELSPLDSYFGIDPDFTGGLSVDEFLRRVRDE